MYLKNTEETAGVCKVCIQSAEEHGLSDDEIRHRCMKCKLIRRSSMEHLTYRENIWYFDPQKNAWRMTAAGYISDGALAHDELEIPARYADKLFEAMGGVI